MQNYSRFIDNLLSYLSNKQAPCSSFEEDHTKHIFNFFYLTAQRWLSDMASLCRPAKTPFIRNHNEILQII